MACCNCDHEDIPKVKSNKFKIALWIALILNLGMFLIEIFGGMHRFDFSLGRCTGFFGDSINYLISLLALGLSLYWRATVALFKGSP